MEKTGFFSAVPIWAWCIAALVILLIILAVHQVRKRKKQRIKLEELAYLKRRDEALSDSLRNPMMGDAGRRDIDEKPMEVRWEDKVVHNGRSSGPVQMIELTELTEYARKKYLFRLDQLLTLGSAKTNTLVLPRDGVAPVHCEIFSGRGRVVIRSRAGVNTLLQRKKKQALVGTEGVFLQDKDQIRLGSALLEVRIFYA